MSSDREKFEKLVKISFPDHTVEKDMMRKAGLDFLPRYVSEFILGQYLSNHEDEEVAIREAKNFVYKHYPEPNSGELIKHRLIENGEDKLLQKFEAMIDIKQIIYTVKVPILREKIRIDPGLTSLYPALLTTGMWGLGNIRHNPTESKKFPIELTDFKPFQIGSFDRGELFDARGNFSLEQWISLLIISLGLNPAALTKNQQFQLLSRLIPLVSKNINLAEFGPKSTGKTYQYRNHSSYTHIISGASITPAKFVFDLITNSPGLISTSDVVVFDEITSADFGQKKDFEMIGLLKDYMEGGNVARGKKEINDDASIVFLGNIEIKGKKPKFEDFVRDLPRAFGDTAFIDRLHGFIPGWEVPKIAQTEVALTSRPGLMSNYLGEALHSLRTWDHPSFIWKHVDTDLLNIRNEKSVRNLAGGMVKLLFPGVTPSLDELNFCLKLAVQLRQNVHDQLSLQEPDEFEPFELKASFTTTKIEENEVFEEPDENIETVVCVCGNRYVKGVTYCNGCGRVIQDEVL